MISTVPARPITNAPHQFVSRARLPDASGTSISLLSKSDTPASSRWGRTLQSKRIARTESSATRSERLASRNPVRPCERDPSHGSRLDRQRNEVLGLEVVDVRLAAGAGEGLRLERQDAKIVRDLAAAELRIEASVESFVLRRYPDRVTAGLPVVVVARRAADLSVLVLVIGTVVAHCDQRCRADRD